MTTTGGQSGPGQLGWKGGGLSWIMGNLYFIRRPEKGDSWPIECFLSEPRGALLKWFLLVNLICPLNVIFFLFRIIIWSVGCKVFTIIPGTTVQTFRIWRNKQWSISALLKHEKVSDHCVMLNLYVLESNLWPCLANNQNPVFHRKRLYHVSQKCTSCGIPENKGAQELWGMRYLLVLGPP